MAVTRTQLSKAYRWVNDDLDDIVGMRRTHIGLGQDAMMRFHVVYSTSYSSGTQTILILWE